MFAPALDTYRASPISNIYIIQTFEIQTVVLGQDNDRQMGCHRRRSFAFRGNAYYDLVFKRAFEIS
jgi:hypothetical protein